MANHPHSVTKRIQNNVILISSPALKLVKCHWLPSLLTRNAKIIPIRQIFSIVCPFSWLRLKVGRGRGDACLGTRDKWGPGIGDAWRHEIGDSERDIGDLIAGMSGSDLGEGGCAIAKAVRWETR